MGKRNRSDIPFPRSLWLLVIGWIALTVAAVLWGVPHVEDHLTEEGSRALSGSTVTASFEGRDAVLSGAVDGAADLDRAVTALLTTTGVRRVVTSAVTVGSVDRTVPAAPAVSAVITGSMIRLAGFLPDSASEEAIVAAAADRFGGSNVAADLDVDAGVSTAPWLAVVPSVLRNWPELDTAEIAFDSSGVTVGGAVASEDLRAAAIAAIVAAAGADLTVFDRLTIVEREAPSLTASLSEGVIAMSGVMPSQDVVDSIEGSAGLVYGPDNVGSAIEVGAVASPDYLLSVPGLFAALRELDVWEATIAEGRVRVSGTGLLESALADAGVALADLWQGSVDLEVALELDATDVASTLTELLQGGTNFEVGSARLSSEAREKLDRAVELLMDNATTRLIVEGHTDDVGGEAANLALSQDRAQAVVDYLVAGGIDADRLEAIGLGESEPIASNDTPEGRAENRRIEFVLVEEGE